MSTVLLIDDDLELLRQMASAFSAAGHRVLVAADGAAGFKVFEAERPHLVVSDIIMPTREGVETIFAIKKARPEVKVLAISGGYRVGPEQFLSLARHIGADDVLAKPFRLGELTARASALLCPRQVAPAPP